MIQYIKKRLTSGSFWVSMFAAIPLTLQALDVNVLPTNYEEVTTIFLSLLVAMGIINDPTTKKIGYGDDDK